LVVECRHIIIGWPLNVEIEGFEANFDALTTLCERVGGLGHTEDPLKALSLQRLSCHRVEVIKFEELAQDNEEVGLSALVAALNTVLADESRQLDVAVAEMSKSFRVVNDIVVAAHNEAEKVFICKVFNSTIGDIDTLLDHVACFSFVLLLFEFLDESLLLRSALLGPLAAHEVTGEGYQGSKLGLIV